MAISEKAGSIDLLIDQAGQQNAPCLILAHGAGAGMEHTFMATLAHGISEKGIHVIRFNFPYKQKGKKMPGSPKESILVIEKVAAFAQQRYPESNLVLSGKSYGGRMSSHLVSEQPCLSIKALVYFGFPLHAPGKNSKDRAAHLAEIDIPQLFLQGTNDALANIDLIKEVVGDQQKADLVAYNGADHSFKTKKGASMSKEEVMQDIIVRSAEWIKGLS